MFSPLLTIMQYLSEFFIFFSETKTKKCCEKNCQAICLFSASSSSLSGSALILDSVITSWNVLCSKSTILKLNILDFVIEPQMHHQLSSLQLIYLFISFYLKDWLLINCGRFMNSPTEWWRRYFSVCLPCWADDKKLKVDARQGLQMELSCFMRYWCLFGKKK